MFHLIFNRQFQIFLAKWLAPMVLLFKFAFSRINPLKMSLFRGGRIVRSDTGI